MEFNNNLSVKSIFAICMFLMLSFISAGQDSLLKSNQQDKSIYRGREQKRKRIILVGIINGAAYGGTMVALYSTWYRNYPQSGFHFFNDNAEWLQIDKVGHAYSGYTEGRLSIAMWRWTGLADKKAIWIGGLSGLFYQSVIEVFDGFSSQWGFSPGDYAANIIGSGLLLSQELGWKEQRITLKFSSHRNSYGDPLLEQRADEIYGKSLPERTLKDYNAQTYWLSGNIKSFFKNASIAPWLNVAVGYGAGGMFGALNNKWTTRTGMQEDRSDITRYRQFFIAPDVDFTRIRTRSKFLKTSFVLLNCLKFPAPAIEFSRKSIRWSWLAF